MSFTDFPLSYGQISIWFAESLSSNTNVYHMPAKIHISGDLDVDLLKSSIVTIVGRHEALRSFFPIIGEDPVMRVCESMELEIELLKGEDVTPDFEKAFINQPFDISRGPLFRFAIAAKENSEWVLYLNFHHLIFDGFSIQIFIKELESFYNRGNLTAETRHDLSIQYGDYSDWLQEQEHSAAFDSGKQFFTKSLEGAQTVLSFPDAKPRSKFPSQSGDRLYFEIDRNYKRINQLAQESEVSPTNILIAAWYNFLSRLCDESDITIGMPVLNRASADLKNVIGLFVNIVPLRIEGSSSSRKALIQQISRVFSHALSHSYYPFKNIIQHCGSGTGSVGGDLFQTMFSFHANEIALQLNGCQVACELSYTKSSKVDLTFEVTDARDRYGVFWEYNTEIFDQATIQRYKEQFIESLENFLSHQTLSQLSPKATERAVDQKGESDYDRNLLDSPQAVKLKALWSELLDAEEIGPDDDFFKLGGHSLLANRLAIRINKYFNQQFTIRDVFINSRFDSMLSSMSQNVGEGSEASKLEIENPTVSAPKMTPFQESLLFLDQLGDDGGNQNISMYFQISGDLRTDYLKIAINEVLKRHSVLRSRFTTEGVDKLEVVEECGVDIECLEMGNDELSDFLKKVPGQKFDLACAPLMRVTLVKTEDAIYHLIVSLHHIITDGWSNSIIMQEVTQIYSGLVKEQIPRLKEPQGQYYSMVRPIDRESKKYQADLAFWKAELKSGIAPINLYADGDFEPTAAGQFYDYTMDEETSRLLAEYSESRKISKFMFLKSAVHCFLHRMTGDREIVTGFPTSGRDSMDSEAIVGPLINTLPVKSEFGHEMSLDTHASLMKEQILKTLIHGSMPFDEIVRVASPRRVFSRHPIFQVLVTMHNNPSESPKLEGCDVSEILMHPGSSVFDLSFSFFDGSEGLRGRFEYRKKVFETRSSEELLGSFLEFVKWLLKNPTESIEKFSLLNAEDYNLLAQLNSTRKEVDSATLDHLIWERAKAFPESTVLVFLDEEYSYKDLTQEVDRWCGYLLSQGVKEGDLVGVSIPRSSSLVFAILAIMRCGATYLPIDPKYPKDRSNSIVDHSGLKTVLTDKNHARDFAPDVKCLLVEDCNLLSIYIPHETTMDPDRLAYVMYTSGSTGKPKGVSIPHRNVVNLFASLDERIGIKAGDCFVSVTSVSFDISVLELFWTLTRGAKLVLVSDEGLLESSDPHKSQTMDFGLFYFGAIEASPHTSIYKLLVEGAEYADKHGFSSVWTPERHFGDFGGAFPNPSVLGAMLASKTKNLKIRAGSVVAPLHHPLRIAEEWSVVDHLSGGDRVGLSLASGWHPNDFVLAPNNYESRFQIVSESVDSIRNLWSGGKFKGGNGVGNDIEVQLFPKPLSADIPIWLTAAGSPETFKKAGEKGCNLLTHLLSQSVDELKKKIGIYRQALVDNGFNPAEKTVTVMLHCFVGEDNEKVKGAVKGAFKNYLRSSFGLVSQLLVEKGMLAKGEEITEEDREAHLDNAFEHFFAERSLLGSTEKCQVIIDQLKGAGATEIGCLVDFGMPTHEALASLRILKRLVDANSGSRHSFDIISEIEKHKGTHFQTTPSLMSNLLKNQARISSLQNLDHILIGGEALPRKLVRVLSNALPSPKLYNMYGPTETTIWSTIWEIDNTSDKVEIGQPIANTEVFILDDHFQLVKSGAVGEIYIAGKGLSPEYLNNADETSRRFIYRSILGETKRIYRTGDNGRLLPSGELECLGRVDQQVKVRGFRIELGDIEENLLKSETIVAAACITKRDKNNDAFLCAFVVAKEKTSVSGADLRIFLESKVPSYMVPAHIVCVDALPLTPNGKIDRLKLQEIDHLPSNKTALVLPSTTIEERLSEIWLEFLSVAQLGVNDNFFEIGGHSLLATQVVNKIKSVFKVNLPIKTLFDSPTIRGLGKILEKTALSDESQIVLKALGKTSDIPLSFQQDRVLFLETLYTESSAYNITAAVEIKGQLDLERLEGTLSKIVEKHHTLRTNFYSTDNGARQSIAEPYNVKIATVDYKGGSKGEQEGNIQSFIADFKRNRYDLATDHMLKASLLILEDQRFVLVFSLHHLIGDDWSIGVLTDEISRIYPQLGKQQTYTVEPMDVQYSDYVYWQKEQFNSGKLGQQLEYWRGRLAGPISYLDFPIDYERKQRGRYKGASIATFVSRKQTENLKKIARKFEGTLYMALLTAFKVLLSRYSGQRDIVIGSPIANRKMEATEAMIGFFANTLVLRTEFAENETLQDSFSKVRATTLGAYGNQDVPFEKIVADLSPERNLNKHPYFEILFNYINTPHKKVEIPGLEFESLKIDDPDAKYLFTLYVTDEDGGLKLNFVYQKELIKEEKISAFMEQYSNLLDQVIANPEKRIDEYVLGDAQYHQRLKDAIRPIEYRAKVSVLAQFDLLCKHSPDAIAIEHRLEKLTYSQLRSKSLAISQGLLNSGFIQGDVSAVHGDKCFEMIAGILGVMYAGGTFLTIDKSLSENRKKSMLMDSKARFIIDVDGDQELKHLASDLDVILVSAKGESTENEILRSDIDFSNLEGRGYIFFTSGSTGKPKGILGTHSGLSHFVEWQSKEFGVQAGDRIAHVTSLNFDVVLREIFLALTTGSTLVIPDVDVRSTAILKWFEKENISIVHVVPSLANVWLRGYLGHIELSGLSKTFFAGEPLKVDLVQRWKGLVGAKNQVVNLYGPTETTLARFFQDTSHCSDQATYRVGRAIPDTVGIILNRNLNLCGAYEVGEIHIKTPYMTKGYLVQQENQTQSFIRNPVNEGENEIVYRTGDLGYYHSDGSITVLGRVDRQIKLNGVRVEPGELEVVACRFDGVKQAFVMGKESNAGVKQVACYLVVDPENQGDFVARDFYDHMRAYFPSFMCPQLISVVSDLPKLPNGKINSKDLPDPLPIAMGNPGQGERPSSEIELKISKVLAEVIEIDHNRLGVDENFFELGIHSLQIAIAHQKLVSELNVEIELVSLFKYPSIKSLARYLGKLDLGKTSEPTSGAKSAQMRREKLRRRS